MFIVLHRGPSGKRYKFAKVSVISPNLRSIDLPRRKSIVEFQMKCEIAKTQNCNKLSITFIARKRKKRNPSLILENRGAAEEAAKTLPCHVCITNVHQYCGYLHARHFLPREQFQYLTFPPKSHSSKFRNMSDIISIRNAAILATVGKDCWHRDKAQRVSISLRLKTSVVLAGETDDVLDTTDYGKIYKAVVDSLDGSKHPNLDVFTREAARIALKTGGGNSVHATVVLPNALLQAGGVGFEVQVFKGGDASDSTALFVKDLKLPCVIGVNPHERQAKQLVIVNMRFYDVAEEGFSDYQSSLKKIQAVSIVYSTTACELGAMIVSDGSSTLRPRRI